MRYKIFIAVPLLIAIIFLCLISAKRSYTQRRIESADGAVQAIQKSHIEGNIPTDQDFDRILNRDIEGYFKAQSIPELKIEYKMLRDGPTQSGVSFPKFYVWVKVFSQNRLYTQGAMRIAAIEQKRFDVTNFLSQSDIKNNPKEVESIFPAMLVEGIISKASE